MYQLHITTKGHGMSSDLGVKINRPVVIEGLLSSSTVALKEILLLQEAPVVVAKEVTGGVVRPLTRRILGERAGGPMVLFEVVGTEAVVGITVTMIPEVPPYTADKEVGLWAGLTVGATRSPTEYALAASIAIALARIEGTSIIDEAGRWNSTYEQDADGFARAITLPHRFKDLATAATALYEALPVGKPT